MSALRLMAGRYAVCRLSADAPVPSWAASGEWNSVTRTADELSVVCAEAAVPGDVQCEGGWRVLQVGGPLDFSLVGVLAAIAAPLAQAGVSIFAVSTFDTDYVLVKEEKLARSIEALRVAGHDVLDH